MSCCIVIAVMNVRHRIRDLREDNNISQQAVAKFLQCDQSLYSKYERGERELPLRYAVALAEYYKVNLDYLVGRTNQRALIPNK